MTKTDPRLLDFIRGRLSDDERREFERRVLEDEGYAARLDQVEEELIDSWVDGSLDADAADAVAAIIAGSRRLQARTDTALGLRVQAQRQQQVAGDGDAEEPARGAARRTVIGTILLALLLAAAAYFVADLRAQRSLTDLESRIQALERELEAARAESLDLRNRLLQAEAEARLRDQR